MQRRVGTWGVQGAAAWLQRFEQSDGQLMPPVTDWRKERSERYPATVVTMYAPSLIDEGPEDIDVAGWPAIVPHLYA